MQFGQLNGSSVALRAAQGNELLFEGTADENGAFGIDLDPAAPEPGLLVLTAAGGMAFDSDGDGIDDGVGSAFNGTLNAVLMPADLAGGAARVSLLTDLAWRYTREHLREHSPEDVRTRLDDIARVFLRQDVDGDTQITYSDLLRIDPHAPAAVEYLNFDYSALFADSAIGQSIAGAYLAGDDALIDQLLETAFGQYLSFYEPSDSRSEHVQLSLHPMGAGTISSADTAVTYNWQSPDAAVLSAIYPRPAEAALLPAEPALGHSLASWSGCASLSADGQQCTVELSEDREVLAIFRRDSVWVSGDFLDLSGADTSLDADEWVDVFVSVFDSELAAAMAQVGPGYVVAGNAGDGFLRRVLQVEVVDSLHYRLLTEPATLTEVIREGTVAYRRSLTNSDVALDDLAPASSSSLPRRAAGNLPGILLNPEGSVRLLKGAPDDTKLRIRIGADQETANRRAVGERVEKLVEFSSGGITLGVTGSIDIELDVDFAAAFSLTGLQSVRLVPVITTTESLDINVNGEWSLNPAPVRIARVSFRPLVFYVGLVRVYLKPTLDVYLSASGQITASVSAGASFIQTMRSGVVYDRDLGTRSVSSFSNSWTLRRPAASFEGQLVSGIEPRMNFLIYGIAGPEITPAHVYIRNVATAGEGDAIDLVDERCEGGVDVTTWLGLTGRFDWKVSEDLTLTSLGELVFDKISSTAFDMYRREWRAASYNIAGECTELLPPMLELEGDPIRLTMDSIDDAESFPYLVRNVGERELNWTVESNDPVYLGVTPASGSVEPGGEQSVEISINPTGLEPGTYQEQLTFRNLFDRGLQQQLPDAQTGTTTRTVDLRVTSGDFPAPTEVIASVAGADQILVEWVFDVDELDQTELEGFEVHMRQFAESPAAFERVGFVPSGSLLRYEAFDLEVDQRYEFEIVAVAGERAGTSAIAYVYLPRELGMNTLVGAGVLTGTKAFDGSEQRCSYSVFVEVDAILELHLDANDTGHADFLSIGRHPVTESPTNGCGDLPSYHHEAGVFLEASNGTLTGGMDQIWDDGFRASISATGTYSRDHASATVTYVMHITNSSNNHNETQTINMDFALLAGE